jgi:hypothetical protein
MRLVKLFAIVCAMFLTSCLLETDPSVKEVSRYTSPDSQMDAVVLQLNFGATTPYVYRFYLVPKGVNPDYQKNHEFLLADGVDGTTVNWVSSKELFIRCLPRRVYKWVNQVSMDSGNVRVEIDSKCSLSENAELPTQ